MMYGTAGGAVMSFKTTDGPDTATATPWDWTIGAGVEMAVTDRCALGDPCTRNCTLTPSEVGLARNDPIP
jgi:hypothetical protein